MSAHFTWWHFQPLLDLLSLMAGYDASLKTNDLMNVSHFFRLAVATNVSKMVKDCYVMPLGAEDKLDPCLLPLVGPGLGPDANKNLLLGLIVR